MTMTLSSPATTTTCPAWCGELHEDEGSPCFGGLIDVELSEATPAETPDGPATTYVSVELWADGNTPTIGLSFGPAAELADIELPDLSIGEAEQLAAALMQLVCRAKVN